MQRISAARAARSFSEILNRVKYRGESFLVVRNQEPVCRIVPVTGEKTLTTGTLEEFWKALPRPDPEFVEDLDRIRRLFRKLPRSAWERRRGNG
ncbi:MAG: type II toxin-antitoxin system Phd/YefM family antitoxin [Terriglobia bacterium]